MYNIEQVDQNINGALGRSAQLTTEWRPELLGGVVAIKGAFADGSPLLAIPNYARYNRIRRRHRSRRRRLNPGRHGQLLRRRRR